MSGKKKTVSAKEEARPGLVPKLRFPKFRGAEGWVSVPLGEVYSFRGNNSLSRDKLNYVAGSVKNIHYGDIHTKFSTHFDITKELVPYINESEEGIVREENLCAEGDIIFADASEDMADIGKSIEIVNLNGERVVSGLHTIIARRKKNRIVIGFGGHLFKSGWVRTQVQKEAQGAKVLGISPKRLQNLRLPLPKDKVEQEKIAECLSSADELMTAQARKVDALKAYRVGLMHRLFPRGGKAKPSLRFPEFKKDRGWEVSAVEEIITTITPPKKLQTSDYRVEGEFPIVDQSQDYICGWTSDGEAAIENGLPVIVFGDHTCVLKFVDRPFVQGADGIKIIRPKYGIDARFLFYALEANPVSPESYKRHFSLLKEKRLLYPDPNSAEQQRIAACLSSLDVLINAEAEKLEALRVHKKGLMQQLFPSPRMVEV